MTSEAPSTDFLKPHVAYPRSPPPKIATHEEAVATAQRLAAEFAKGAAERDRERRAPWSELDAYSGSGLWAINVPKAYGGPGLGYRTVVEVMRIVSAADGSLGQLPQNHFGLIDVLAAAGTEAQKHRLFGLILKGFRLGNAYSEAKTPNVTVLDTRVRREGDDFVIQGEKAYCTGALYAHLVPVTANDDDGKPWLAFAPRDSGGLTVVDDWSSFGQRTTASGTVRLDNVRVKSEDVIALEGVRERPSINGPVAQILQAAIDAGLAAGALEATVRFVRERARPWPDSGADRASKDPFTLVAVGDLAICVHGAEALLNKAALLLDGIPRPPSADDVARASVAVAIAKIASTEAALLAANKLFELGGTRSTLLAEGLDRHWRDARTHTLHDPVRWKYHLIGNYALNGRNPPRHSWN
jgi:SfnB family sulfur acquisition oxidoreductase